ncbi:hypothetical protein [Serratia sarumanii]|nr:hypothetical protein O3T10_12815 [Serratia marcescens]
MPRTPFYFAFFFTFP